MRFIGIAILALTLYFTMCADIKTTEGKEIDNLLYRFLASFLSSVMVCLVLGLPILGIYYLLTY